MGYRREIDGLRAIAVVAVILFHAGFTTFSGGYAGVDIFFVISGYLITGIIESSLNENRFSIFGFYERRARRILPALFLVMAVCLPFAWFWLLPSDTESFASTLIAVPIFASNILFYRTSGYFESAGELKPLLHTWSLAIEEQFYLLYPLLFLLFWRIGKSVVIAMALFVFILSLEIAELWVKSAPDAAFYLLHARSWELMMGALAALNSTRLSSILQRAFLSEIASSTGLAMIAYAIFFFDDNTPNPGLYTLVPTVGAVLIIAAANQSNFIGRALSARYLAGLGVISYSAYLWHQPVFAFTRNVSVEDPTKAVYGLLIVITLVLAWFSWKYVETPFRNADNFSRVQIFKFFFLGAAFFVFIGCVGLDSSGFHNRFTNTAVYEGELGQTDFFHYMEDHYFSCKAVQISKGAPDWEGFARCRQSKQYADVEVAILGDSHAESLFIGIAKELSDKNVAYYIKTSVPLINNSDFAGIFSDVLESKSIKAVVITAYWAKRANAVPLGKTFENELSITMATLIGAGKSVYLIGDVPHFSFRPEHCKFVTRGLGLTVNPRCDMPRDGALKGEETFMPAIRHVINRIPAANYGEIKNLLCDDSKCSMVKNGTLMYRDEDHLNIAGSRYLGSEVVKLFPELRNPP